LKQRPQETDLCGKSSRQSEPTSVSTGSKFDRPALRI
jgi:hypothetical protein